MNDEELVKSPVWSSSETVDRGDESERERFSCGFPLHIVCKVFLSMKHELAFPLVYVYLKAIRMNVFLIFFLTPLRTRRRFRMFLSKETKNKKPKKSIMQLNFCISMKDKFKHLFVYNFWSKHESLVSISKSRKLTFSCHRTGAA